MWQIYWLSFPVSLLFFFLCTSESRPVFPLDTPSIVSCHGLSAISRWHASASMEMQAPPVPSGVQTRAPLFRNSDFSTVQCIVIIFSFQRMIFISRMFNCWYLCVLPVLILCVKAFNFQFNTLGRWSNWFKRTEKVNLVRVKICLCLQQSCYWP